MEKEYTSCRLCPRECNAQREKGGVGVCGVGSKLKLARASLHMWEEPCISGERGSGTVFFSGCSLGCIYCQNKEISRGNAGKEIGVDRLIEIFYELRDKGAHNINLVTPSHYVPTVAYAIEKAKGEGFELPFVYNSSGYEKKETLKMLSGLVDVYLPDFKYACSELAEKYSAAPDYFEVAKQAIAEMVSQQPEAVFDSEGMMKKGVLVRHLMLPDSYENSRRVLEYLYSVYKDSIYISLMSQYTPLCHSEEYPELNMRVKKSDYEALVRYAIRLGVENGFIQEGTSARESFIPQFDCEGV